MKQVIKDFLYPEIALSVVVRMVALIPITLSLLWGTLDTEALVAALLAAEAGVLL